jgi:hypothetical protein
MIYFFNYPSGAEIFIMVEQPDNLASQYVTPFHSKCSQYPSGLDVSSYRGLYLIINHKQGFTPVVS